MFYGHDRVPPHIVRTLPTPTSPAPWTYSGELSATSRGGLWPQPPRSDEPWSADRHPGVGERSSALGMWANFWWDSAPCTRPGGGRRTERGSTHRSGLRRRYGGAGV